MVSAAAQGPSMAYIRLRKLAGYWQRLSKRLYSIVFPQVLGYFSEQASYSADAGKEKALLERQHPRFHSFNAGMGVPKAGKGVPWISSRTS